jgi:ankyrin repeat protein
MNSLKLFSIKTVSCLCVFILAFNFLSCIDNRTPEQLTNALLKQCVTCDADELESLIEKGADVNGTGDPSGERPLRIAAVNGHLPCVKKLLELGADPTLTNQNRQLVSSPRVAAEIALMLLKEAQKTPPDILPMMNPALKEVLDRKVSAETYEEIIKVLEEAEKYHKENK